MTDVRVDVRLSTRKAAFDAPNMYPTVKPIIDGMVRAGLWPDDNYRWIRDMTFRYDPRPTGRDYGLTFTITPTGVRWVDVLDGFGLRPTPFDHRTLAPYGLDG